MYSLALALAAKTVSGATSQSSQIVMLLISSGYFVFFFSIEDFCGKFVVVVCIFIVL